MSGQSANPLSLDLAHLCLAPVGAELRARARLHVLDWAGCALAGAVTPAGRAMRAALEGEATGQGPCALAGGGRGSPLAAALMNGAVGNVLEMDDVDKRAILHPGPVVIPAALAAAEARGADMEAFLDAVVRGYEAVIRVGRAVGPGHYAFWHNTGTCGPFGAAMAAASILELDDMRSAHALGLAGTQTSGLWQTRHEPGSMAKQLHTARAAHAGLLAARLSASRFDGPLAVLEGPQGLFAATCPGGDPAAAATPMTGWRIAEVSFKPWPACRHAHAAIDAALAVRCDADGAEIDAVQVRTYPDALSFCDRPDPRTITEAKFSLQHAVAVTLLRGAPGLAEFEPAAIGDPAVRLLASRVSVESGPPYADAYPARYGAGVEVRLQNGRRLEAAIPDALGDPENPVEIEALLAKFRTLTASAGVDERAAADISRILSEDIALNDFSEALAAWRMTA